MYSRKETEKDNVEGSTAPKANIFQGEENQRSETGDVFLKIWL